MPGLGWPAAFVLGAIVSPPDAVAATAIARRLRIPHRVVTILEGESLVNDAAALVLYRAAVIAAVTGAFTMRETLGQFVLAAVGGVTIGLAVGFVTREALHHAEDSLVETAITLLAPTRRGSWRSASTCRPCSPASPGASTSAVASARPCPRRRGSGRARSGTSSSSS